MIKKKEFELAMKFAELKAIGLVKREIEKLYYDRLTALSSVQKRMYFDFINPPPVIKLNKASVRKNAKR